MLQTSISCGQPTDTCSKPLSRYQEALDYYEQIGVIQNHTFCDDEKMQICYSSQVSVVVPNFSHHIVGSSHVTFPQRHLAREVAAKDAVQQLESLRSPLQLQRGTVTTIMVDIVISADCR